MHCEKLSFFCAMPAKSIKPEFNHEKTTDKSKQRDTLQNKCVMFLSNINILKYIKIQQLLQMK